jgi:hypothetical protein
VFAENRLKIGNPGIQTYDFLNNHADTAILMIHKIHGIYTGNESLLMKINLLLLAVFSLLSSPLHAQSARLSTSRAIPLGEAIGNTGL